MHDLTYRYFFYEGRVVQIMSIYENNSILYKCLCENLFILGYIQLVEDFQPVPKLLEELL